MTDFVSIQAEAWNDIWRRFGHNGPGSSVEATVPAREWLARILKEHEITSMLDAPCGDFSWMRLVDFGDVRYTGYDVEPDIIATNCQRYPDYTFKQVNLLTTPRLPNVDLIWCRDFFIHLPVEMTQRVLKKFTTAARYLAVTNHPHGDNAVELPPEGHDNRPGYWCRGVNLEAEPFNLTGRIDSVTEAPDGTGAKVGQELVLFDLRS